MTDLNKTRLNINLRSTILQNTLEATIWKKMEALLIEQGQLAEEARQLSFGGKLEEVESLMAAIHSAAKKVKKLTSKEVSTNGYGLYNDRISTNVNGMTFMLNFITAPEIRFHDLKSTRLDYKSHGEVRLTEGSSYREHIVIHDDDLKARIMANADAIEALNTESESIIPTITEILRKAQTVGKLLDLWPEAKPYLPEDMTAKQAETANLPISVADLNNKLSALAA